MGGLVGGAGAGGEVACGRITHSSFLCCQSYQQVIEIPRASNIIFQHCLIMDKRIFQLSISALLVMSCALLNMEKLPVKEDSTTTPNQVTSTALPTQPAYYPGQLVDYLAQAGDMLPALAVHFNTTEAEIRKANPDLSQDVTTLLPGLAMKIPIHYSPIWGTPYQIVPDNVFINGPLAGRFKTSEFIARYPGWLKDYSEYAGGLTRSGTEIVDLVALNFSVSPQILLTLLEYQLHALTDPQTPQTRYMLGYVEIEHEGLYLQLVWAANILNNGYYGWRSGPIKTFEHVDGKLERPDPWQNAATVAIQSYFLDKPESEYSIAIGPEGMAKTFKDLFGNPWEVQETHIPGSLQQPVLLFPFHAGETWSFTGGPHPGWGTLEPYAAIDFAPPENVGICNPSKFLVTAMADGVVARSEAGIVVLDLDGDGDERTGWNIIYLHVAIDGRVTAGTRVNAGDSIGHPSCEGRGVIANGTHVHIARKYNGEWIPAGGTLAFNLEGWIAQDGLKPYLGTLTRGSETITACMGCVNSASRVTAGQ